MTREMTRHENQIKIKYVGLTRKNRKKRKISINSIHRGNLRAHGNISDTLTVLVHLVTHFDPFRDNVS